MNRGYENRGEGDPSEDEEDMYFEDESPEEGSAESGEEVYEEEPEEERVLPEWACAYCQNDDVNAVAQCMVCKKWFCNSYCKDGSHIIQHLIYSDHKSIRLHPNGLQKEYGDSPICCFNNPAHTNIFNLGTIQSDKGFFSIICRDQCLDKPRLKEIGWDADTWSHIVKDKHVASFLLDDSISKDRNTLKISREEIRALENVWKKNPEATLDDVYAMDLKRENELEPIPSSFGTAKEYNRIFIPIINAEMESDKEDNDVKCIESVNLRWENGIGKTKIAIFHTDVFDSRYRMNVGQLLQLHLPISLLNTQEEISFEAKVIFIKDNEVRVQVNDTGDLPLGQTNGYRITFSWVGITFERMRRAANELFSDDCMSDYLYNCLMGNKADAHPFPALPIRSLAIPGQPELNNSQSVAVRAALQNELTLIQGPPGTGKTSECVVER